MQGSFVRGFGCPVFLAITLAGCGGGGDDSGGNPPPPPPPPAVYSIGGTVTGLVSSGLVLQNNGGDDLPVNGTGIFTFATPVQGGNTYAVTVKTQPARGPAQRCTVTNGAGTVGSTAVTQVTVNCQLQVAKFLFTANSESDNVSGFAINAATGALDPVAGSPNSTGIAPLFVTANRAGTHLYVSNQGGAGTSPSVSAFSIGASGALTAVAGSPFPLSDPPPPAVQSPVSKPLLHPSGTLGYMAIRGAPELYGATLAASGAMAEIDGLPATGIGQNFSSFNSSGNVLYVPHDNLDGTSNGGVTAFAVQANTGQLTSLGSFATGGRVPAGITLTTDDRFLFTANSASGTVAAFAVAANGALAQVTGSPFATGPGTYPTSVTVHPLRDFVYVTSTHGTPELSSIAAFRMDPLTGVLTATAGSPFATGGFFASVPVVDPTGRFLYVANSGNNTVHGYSIDQATGALTALNGFPLTVGAGPAPAVMDPSGKYLYVVNSDGNSVQSYAIDATTGALTLVDTALTGMRPRFPELAGLQ